MNSKCLQFLYQLKDQKNARAQWEFGPKVEATVTQYFEQYYYNINSPSSNDTFGELSGVPIFW